MKFESFHRLHLPREGHEEDKLKAGAPGKWSLVFTRLNLGVVNAFFPSVEGGTKRGSDHSFISFG